MTTLTERIYAALVARPAGLTNMELAYTLGSSPASVSSLTCKMAAKGRIVRRVKTSEDRWPFLYFIPKTQDRRR